LHWLKDTLPSDKLRIIKKLSKLMNGSAQGKAIRQDLLAGFHALPAWMQAVVRELPDCQVNAGNAEAASAVSIKRRPRAEAPA
jgi:hypothetical protein